MAALLPPTFGDAPASACSRAPHLASTQLFAGPSSAAQQPAWLHDLRAWRAECNALLHLNDSLFDSAALAWTSRAFVTTQMHPWDLSFYSRERGYTPRAFLDELRKRYGGVDSLLMWPSYPHLGIDDRSQYDYVRLLPGGVEAVRAVVAELRAANVTTLLPYNPWDTGTRDEGASPEKALAALVADVRADGFNADTMGYIPESFYTASTAAGRPAAMQAELGGAFSSLAYTTLGWGEWDRGGASASLEPAPPRVDVFKWLQRRRMTTVVRRGDTNRTDALQTAWFNGVGYVAWENVWGRWNEISPRDGELLARVRLLLHYFGARGFLHAEGWEPHSPVATAGVFASRFPLQESGGGSSCAAGGETLWALVERSGRNVSGAPVLSLDAPLYAGCRFFDVTAGVELAPSRADAGQLTLAPALEAGGVGAVLATRNGSVGDLGALLETMRRRSRNTLASFRGTWTFPSQRRVATPAPARRAPPATSVRVAGGKYRYRVAGAEVDGDPVAELQYEGEDYPQAAHDLATTVAPYRIDVAPVSCAAYAAYLTETGYTPADDRGFLRYWPDWRRGAYPAGNASTPVVGVSLSEAKSYCAWAGGRLPTGVEWQYAAQGGDATRAFPWGADDRPTLRPQVARGRTCPAPHDSRAFAPRSASPLGLVDLVGNVWQYTADEFEDGHSHFVMLRGGAHYTLNDASEWYYNSGGWRVDRHARYNLMDDAYERAATLGFRCAYDDTT